MKQIFKNNNKLMKYCLTGIVTLSALCTAQAYTFPDGTTTITKSQWDNAIASAEAGNLQINLPAETISMPSVTIVSHGLTIKGKGHSTRLVFDQYSGDVNSHAFKLQAKNVTFQDMVIMGKVKPVTDVDYAEFTDVTGGTVLKGLEHAIWPRRYDTDKEPENLTVKNIWFFKTHDCIRYQHDVYPHGLTIENVDATCTGMVVVAVTHVADSNPQNELKSKVTIRDVRIVNNARELSDEGRYNTPRAFVLDFGNDKELPDLPPVDCKETIIEDNIIPKLVGWDISLNRAYNVVIRDNDFGGGGWAGNESMQHCLHFEDNGRYATPIQILNNKMHQTNTQGVWYPNIAYIWASRTEANIGPRLLIEGNTYSGLGTKLSLSKRSTNVSTTGVDVPADQKGTLLGPDDVYHDDTF